MNLNPPNAEIGFAFALGVTHNEESGSSTLSSSGRFRSTAERWMYTTTFPTTVSSTLGVSRPARSSRQVCASLGEDEIETYRDNARAFIASDRYRPFTKQAFAELLVEAVEEDLASRT